jgi:Fe-S cluster assembly protein SufD
LNTALGLDGVFIHVAAGTVIDKAVQILQISSVGEQVVMNSRNLLVVEKNAQLTFVEHFVSNATSSKSFHNTLSEVVVEDDAIVSHYKIQEEEGHAMQVNTCQVQQGKKSVYNNYTFTFGGEMVRNNLNIVLENSYTETHLFGLYIAGKDQLVDNHTLVDHRMPNCESNELYKGIAKDNATATFNGKIFVRKDAQKTNAFQSNKNILLGDEATINTKPQLEIYADDVKCSHGTSTGKIDQEALFYLRSRGIGVPAAQQLLMHAFAEEVVDAIKHESIKTYVENLLQKKF